MIKPIRDNILAELEAEVKDTFLELPVSINRDKSLIVKVVAFGESMKNKAIKIGSRLLIDECQGADIKDPDTGHDYKLLRPNKDILAIVCP